MSTMRINVSELHLLHRCPHLLAASRQGKAGAWRMGLDGDGRLPGKWLHDKVIAPWFAALAQGPGNPLFQQAAHALDADALAWGLIDSVQQGLFFPLLKRQGKRFTPEQVTRLSQGVEAMCRHVGEFLATVRHGDAATLLATCCHPPEQELVAEVALPGRGKVRVTGRMDALLFDPRSHRGVIWEFKGLGRGNSDEDSVQLALYAWLVARTTGVTPDGMLLHLDDPGGVTRLAAHDLAGLIQVDDLLIQAWDLLHGGKPGAPSTPRLCDACRFAGSCAGARKHAAPELTPVPEELITLHQPEALDPEAEAVMTALLHTLRGMKLAVEGDGYVTGPRFMRLKVRPLLATGTTVSKLRNQGENLQVALHLTAPPLIRSHAGHVGIDIPRRLRTPLTLSDLWQRGATTRPDSPVALPMGLSLTGEVVWIDLARPEATSMLVGGSTGSGKTVLLQSLAVSLARGATPAQARLTLIDPKRVGFGLLQHLPHLTADGVIRESEQALTHVTALVEEMERRYRMLERARVEDLAGYRRQGGHDLPHQVVIIDEYADLLSDRKHKETLEAAIQRLGQKGRAAGIHLILATQRPDARVVTPLIKANLPLKVALKVTSKANSRIILDDEGAESLLGAGDMLLAGSLPLQRVQGAMVSGEEIKGVSVAPRN